MNKSNLTKISTLIVLCLVPFVLTACTKSSSTSSGNTSGESKKVSSEFPLPSDAASFTDFGNGSVNFQTKLSITESLNFYKKEFAKSNITERTINTATTDTTFSIVFDGAKNGQAIVVQGVTIGDKTNINIRYEKI